MKLQSTIERLAADFTSTLLAALRQASVDDLAAVATSAGRAPAREPRAGAKAAKTAPRGAGGRLARRSADDIAALVQKIASLLATHPEGLRAEQIREELGLDTKELPRPLKEGVAAGLFATEGQKRATTYSLGTGTPPKRGARGAKKKAGRGGK